MLPKPSSLILKPISPKDSSPPSVSQQQDQHSQGPRRRRGREYPGGHDQRGHDRNGHGRLARFWRLPQVHSGIPGFSTAALLYLSLFPSSLSLSLSCFLHILSHSVLSALFSLLHVSLLSFVASMSAIFAPLSVRPSVCLYMRVYVCLCMRMHLCIQLVFMFASICACSHASTSSWSCPFGSLLQVNRKPDIALQFLV